MINKRIQTPSEGSSEDESSLGTALGEAVGLGTEIGDAVAGGTEVGMGLPLAEGIGEVLGVGVDPAHEAWYEV